MSALLSQIPSRSIKSSLTLLFSDLGTIPGAKRITLDGRTIQIYHGLKELIKESINKDQVDIKEATSKDFSREECIRMQLDSSFRGLIPEFTNIQMPLETNNFSNNQHNNHQTQQILQHRQDRTRR